MNLKCIVIDDDSDAETDCVARPINRPQAPAADVFYPSIGEGSSLP